MADKDKSSRPKFSAPKAPAGKDDILTNAEETRPLTDTVVETASTGTIPIDTSNTSPKVVSRTTDSTPTNSIDSVLSEKSTQKITDESSPPASPKKSASKGCRCNAILVGIATFSLIIGLSGWVLYFSTSGSVNIFGTTNSPTPTPTTPASSVSPTPVSNSKVLITLEVLNGSGVSGLAGKTADTLANLGYTILSTGNAANSNYTLSEVYTNPEFTNPEVLLKDLEAEFGSATIAGTLKDSTASARIIVGKDWAD